MTQGSGDRETRDRLLREAELLFAERGFNDVTVREICSAAHANVASVNYHFGDKLGLYREVMRTAIAGMQALTQAAREAGDGLAPADRLRAYISIFLHRLLAPGSETVQGLLQREMHDPTPALDDIVEQGLRPRLDYLAQVIAEMIGADPADKRVMLCVMSVMSQSVMYAKHNAVAERLGYPATPTTSEIDAAAQHIAEFSIGGILAISQNVELRTQNSEPKHATT
jgi:TetR/AcrR family transcriptional regulator, regulator of cefoperazone and chloramphenicol sensitivity